MLNKCASHKQRVNKYKELGAQINRKFEVNKIKLTIIT